MLSTIELLDRYKQGDEAALDALFARSVPALRRWARGLLPQWARGLNETQDLVQEAVAKSMPRLLGFEARHPGALQAYLRRAVSNHIRDEIRKVKTRPVSGEVPETHPDPAPSPLEQAMGREGFARYEAALAMLRPSEQEAIVARLELQQSYEEVAIALGKPTANAARVAVTRALERLIATMATLS
ncbi:MAG: sigma-70 family RNA polymerase sigma factor [Acidobacteria bacterium]|nr:sigma-70 family RNA polymerase sigma factor [Acidobacteriota bacterium]